ncbi:LysE family translocator [Sphingomonas montanisoli]|uniref:LysE family translocator n=1 Tax=Sphingomonas montanisoli TaxID=2606412 RepID=A0A5D9CA09_9SPHN|nr:LysE family translocator [Sphingomonas montanisoli]TZG27900.1 LysE family translocator [Sphingomonas montanisoli]
MTLAHWWIFVCATFLVSAMPGPNMLHIMTRAMRHGVARATFAMAGCMLALLTLFGLSAAGMSALLSALPQLLGIIKVGGAAYLIWVGIKAWRDRGTPVDVGPNTGNAAIDPQASAGQLFRGGYLISIANPKALIFAAAFFPQFIDASAPKAPQFAILLATFAVIETAWYFTYALGGRSLSGLLREMRWQRRFNRATGALFVGFGLSLLAWRR